MTNLKRLSVLLLAGGATFSALPVQAQDAAAGTPAAVAPDQSTNVGTIDVQGAGQTLGSGYIVPEDGPKDRSTVTHEGIENLPPTVNPFQMISILPGVNQMSEDALGLAGGTIRVRGLVASQMGFTINGAPFNDSGTFNVYPSEIIDSENVRQIWVTQGSTDIDAPHVGASGGNIGVLTRAPRDNFNVQLEQGFGQLDEFREFGAIDSGWIGNFKGFVSISHTSADKWRGDGGHNRDHIDANMLWQFLPQSSIGITLTYNVADNSYYRDYGGGIAFPAIYNVYISGKTAYQTFQTIGRKADYDTFWGTSSAYPIYLKGPFSTASCATAHDPACQVNNPDFPSLNTGGLNTNVSNDYNLNLNPYRNGVVTVPLHVQFTDNLRWDTNAYLWWGTGGADFGSTSLTEGSVFNGYTVAPQYGDATGSKNALLALEATTNTTFRPGFATKVVYDVDNYTFSVGGWMENARLHYAQPFSLVNPDGTGCDVWMTNKTTSNACAITGTSTNGTGLVYANNYLADSTGESIYFEGQGRFLNDTLKISVGVADRAIIRSVANMNPICADNPGLVYAPGSTTVTCASFANSTAFLGSSAYQYFNGPSVGAAAAYAAMRQFAQHPHLNYQKVLPEFNASFDLDTSQQLFAGLSTGFRSPSVSNLSQFTSGSSATSSNFMKLADVKSEYAYSWEAGYRYHDDFMVLSATAYLQDLYNYQASVQIDPGDFITSNIGGVKIYGIDLEAGTKPWHGFTFYGSAEIQNSRLSAAYLPADYSGSGTSAVVQYVGVRGKQLVDTPNWIVSASVGYAEDGFFADITPHCQGMRPTALSNDEFIPGNCIVNASAGYHFGAISGAFKDATLQIYAVNLFDSNYFGEVYTQGQTNAKNVAAVNAQGVPEGTTLPGQSYAAEPGAPLFVGAKFIVDIGD